MKSGPDASIRNLVGKSRHVGPAVAHVGCGGAGHRDLGYFCGSEHRLDDTRDGPAEDTVRARILRMHRRIIDWLPSRLTVGSRVVVDIAVANSGNRPPKVVMVLGVEHRDQRLVEPNRDQRHEPRAVADIHLLCRHEIAREGVIGWWADHQPKPGDLGLLGRALGTGLAAIVLDLIVVSCPLLAVQRNRRTWPKLGWGGHGERLHL